MEINKSTNPFQINRLSDVSPLTKKIIALGLVFFVFLALGFLIKNNKEVKAPVKKQDPTSIADVEYSKALLLSVGGADIVPLQDYVAKRIKEGINDNLTKSAIYWVTHRYFDNGGNINEIYDFVKVHPEVSFMKDAEKVYPDIFAKIEAKKVENYSMDSILALLAYYNAIDAHGYANIAIWGLAANKYSELAYRATKNADFGKGTLSKNDKTRFRGQMIEKAMYYMKMSDQYVTRTSLATQSLESLKSQGLRDEDLLVGLNQYASAIQHLKGVGIITQHPFSPSQLYEFNVKFALEKVPRLYFFTNYLYATSLIVAGEVSQVSVKIPLDKVVEYGEANKDDLKPKGSVMRVINSKTAGEASIFSVSNTRKLASVHEGFKKWLIKNGWAQTDF